MKKYINTYKKNNMLVYSNEEPSIVASTMFFVMQKNNMFTGANFM